MPYEPTAESLRAHRVPDWFQRAKLGFMVHWGPCSIPAWAERAGSIQDLWTKRGPGYVFKHNPYAEWYENTIRIPGSGAQRHHRETYGPDFRYEDFIPQFNDLSRQNDPSSWAELIERAGGRYVVLITKHHDGYTLWPSRHPNPHQPGFAAERDIVGEITEAVRARGLTMGLYYSAGYDKTFNDTVIRNLRTAATAIPQGEEYARYCTDHYLELIERYQPSVLWNDIAFPAKADRYDLFARYYNAVPEGVVNDRWSQISIPERGARRLLVEGALDGIGLAWRALPAPVRRLQSRPNFHYDFSTPEYAALDAISERKWEAVRGIGLSFGNNREEQDADLLSSQEIVRMLADVVSKNGNLLLGIAPDATGVFPEAQRRRLLELGAWLAVNGEAIYDTTPWTRAEGRTMDGLPVRFTRNEFALFAIVLAEPAGGRLVIESLPVAQGGRVRLLGHEGALTWERQGDHLVVVLPEARAPAPALALRISPPPEV